MLINLLTQSIRKKKHFLIVPSSNDNINTIQNLLFKNIITCFSKLQNKKGSFFIIFLNCSKNFQPNIGYVSGSSKKTTNKKTINFTINISRKIKQNIKIR